MATKAKVIYGNSIAGYLEKHDSGYRFTYTSDYLNSGNALPVSQTLPLSKHPHYSRILFSFFDGLIPEGWLLNIATQHWHIKGTDRFELLLTLCRDTIGAVTVWPIEEEEENG